jgi:hypothetical protein
LKVSALIDLKNGQKRNDDGRDMDRKILNDCFTELESNQAKLREVLGNQLLYMIEDFL